MYDNYAILGLTQGATVTEVQRAYAKKMLTICQADESTPEMESNFEAIKKAYHELCEVEPRTVKVKYVMPEIKPRQGACKAAPTSKKTGGMKSLKKRRKSRVCAGTQKLMQNVAQFESILNAYIVPESCGA